MQSRYLTCDVETPYEAHAYVKIDNLNSTEKFTNEAIKNLKTMDFIGIMEFYQESLCLFQYQLMGSLPSNCNSDFIKDEKPRKFIRQHYDETDVPIEIRKKVDYLIKADIELYKEGLKIFFHRINLLEKETNVTLLHEKILTKFNEKVDYL